MITNSTVNVFRGFCTIGPPIKKNWTYYDIELVKRDLMFAFKTRVGERVMRPDYGCKIFEYLFEPFTPGIAELIVAEATRICELDSRLTVVNITAYTYGQGIRVELTLQYAPFGVIDTFYVDYDARQDAELGFQ
jgi:phage baseplate assembly protein W